MWKESDPLDVRDILDWADAHYERTGQYPDVTCGRVADAPEEKWIYIDDYLRRGGRGLPSGWSLAQLLDELRGKRNPRDLPRHTLRKILAWADAHYARSGVWPTLESGAISDAPGESWHAVDMALRAGVRGLRGGSSLARLLRNKRGVRRKHRRQQRKESEGRRPRAVRVRGGHLYSRAMWAKVKRLRAGRNIQRLPPITIKQILKWADEHFARVGAWPSAHTAGLIEGTRGETWWAVEMALSHGLRGLPGDSSLALVLAEHRGVRTPRALSKLTIEEILGWADSHRKRRGEWPSHLSGTIPDTAEETWSAVNHALRRGRRGLPGGSSLARLLDEYRADERPQVPVLLSVAKILHWADAWHRRHGKWPFRTSGPIPESAGDNWRMVDAALIYGNRGLDGGSSLAQLLAEHRGKRNSVRPPRLTEEQILGWADAYFARHGRWPVQSSGALADSPGETWAAINQSLKQGRRGLPGGLSLARLLAGQRGKPYGGKSPPLTEEQILNWADAYCVAHGSWPTKRSGAVEKAPAESWKGIDQALVGGFRGLPGGSSLAKLLDRHRRKVPQLVASAVDGGAGLSQIAEALDSDAAPAAVTLPPRDSAGRHGRRPVRIRPK